MKDGTSRIVITDGHRRYGALKLANELREKAQETQIDKVPVILKKPTTSAVDLAYALYQENSGQGLSMIETAVMAKRLSRTGLKTKEIADRLGKTERYVSDLMILIDASLEIRALVMEGKVSGTEVVKRIRQAENKMKGRDKAEIDAAVAASMKELVLKAAETGRTKITSKDTEAPKEPTEKHTMTLVLEKGARYDWEKDGLGKYQYLFEDEEWYETTKKEGIVKVLENISIKVVLTRAAKVQEVEPESPAPEAAPKTRGRKSKVAGDDGVKATEVDPMTMGDLDGEEGVDLKALGIADPTEEDPAADL
jgi:ParB-like chromosome segregation protein Spo0J